MPGVLDSFRLDGQVACVTGTTRGIGRSGRDRARRGGLRHRPHRSPRSGRDARGDRERSAVAARSCELDLEAADAGACERAIEAAAAAFGRLDVLVNSAGAIARGTGARRQRRGGAARAARRPRLRARALARRRPHLRRRRAAARSSTSRRCSRSRAACSSRRMPSPSTACSGLTRALANEWAPHGVRVNAIAPGYIATDFTERLREDPERYQEILDRIPAGRWGTPDDLAGRVRLPLLAGRRLRERAGAGGRRRLAQPLNGGTDGDAPARPRSRRRSRCA